ncbi:MAG: hypothetical protein JWP34_5113 [Massilia sp.]|nr:hypothetical protein [Massilia sp.]
MYPEHQARKASAEYKRVHDHLIHELDEPCWVCGVRRSTLGDPAHNPHGATQMETHHWHVEWALANAIDPVKILSDFPELGVADDEHLRRWLDSEGNMLVLCDVHHRHGHYGIHEITYPVWISQKYARTGWDLVEGPVAPAPPGAGGPPS